MNIYAHIIYFIDLFYLQTSITLNSFILAFNKFYNPNEAKIYSWLLEYHQDQSENKKKKTKV